MQIDEQIDKRQIERKMNGCMDAWIANGSQRDGWLMDNGQIDGLLMDGWMDEQMNGWMDRIDGWIGCIDGCMC